VRTHETGYPIYSLANGEHEIVISAFGGQLISWTKQGVPILFENAEHAIVDGKTPYRGGAPICFPYFGKGALMPLGTSLTPQHGHARTTVWKAKIEENSLVLTTNQPSPAGYGPTEFQCQLTYRLSEILEIHAIVKNVGEAAAPFQLAVHSYWATSQPADAIVRGLGNRYLDNMLNLSEHIEPDSTQPHIPPFDRDYVEASNRLEVENNRFKVTIVTAGSSGAVLWNPGPDHGLKDLGSPDFICVEAGVIVPAKTLNPGEQLLLEISYDAELR
jgi:glucose-6-phosphate 1-epimerase